MVNNVFVTPDFMDPTVLNALLQDSGIMKTTNVFALKRISECGMVNNVFVNQDISVQTVSNVLWKNIGIQLPKLVCVHLHSSLMVNTVSVLNPISCSMANV